MIFGTAPALTPPGRAVCVFFFLRDIPGPNPNTKTLLCPFPSLSLFWCPLPDTRPWAPPGSCEEGFNLLRGSGARQGGLAAPPRSEHSNAPIVWGRELGWAEVGGMGPPAPHTSLTSPRTTAGCSRGRGMTLPCCWGCAGAGGGCGWLWGGASFLFQGDFGVQELGCLASPCTFPQSFLPHPSASSGQVVRELWAHTCAGSQSRPARLPPATLSQGSLIPAQRRSVCTQGIFILLLLPVSC